MTDKRIKEPCPFCGNEPEKIKIKKFATLNVLSCSCGCEIRDTNKQRLIDRWNRRYR